MLTRLSRRNTLRHCVLQRCGNFQRRLVRASNGSSLRQPRLAQPVNKMLEVLGVLEGGSTFPAFNRESRVDPQHVRGLGSRFLKLSQPGVPGCQPSMRPLHIGHAQCAFAQPTHRLPIALEHIIDDTHCTEGVGRLKRIERVPASNTSIAFAGSPTYITALPNR